MSFLCDWELRLNLWCSMTATATFIGQKVWECSIAMWTSPSHRKPGYLSIAGYVCLRQMTPRTRVSRMAKPCFAATTVGCLPRIIFLAHSPSKKVVITRLEAADVSKYDHSVCNYEVLEFQPMISPLPKGPLCELSSWSEQHPLKTTTLTCMFNAANKIKLSIFCLHVQDACSSEVLFNVKHACYVSLTCILNSSGRPTPANEHTTHF